MYRSEEGTVVGEGVLVLVGAGVFVAVGVNVGGVGVGRGVSVEIGDCADVGGGVGASVGIGIGDCMVTVDAGGCVVAGITGISLGRGVLVGIVVSAGGVMGVSLSVLIAAGVPIATGVQVCVLAGLEVPTGTGSARRRPTLPQTYDDIEQQEQTRQPIRKRSAWSSSKETDSPPPMGRTVLSLSSRRRREMITRALGFVICSFAYLLICHCSLFISAHSAGVPVWALGSFPLWPSDHCGNVIQVVSAPVWALGSPPDQSIAQNKQPFKFQRQDLTGFSDTFGAVRR